MIGNKRSGKVLALLGGIATAAGGGYLIANNNAGVEPTAIVSSGQSPQATEAPAKETKTETKAAEQVASLPETKPESKPEVPATADLQLPKFDILRVEKDGSVVIAGTAPANSAIEIIEGDSVLSTARSGAGGDFAIVFEKPLTPGDHELIIRATPDNGLPVKSAEVGVVTIPEANDAKGEVLAMVQQQGEATRVLQAPTMEQPKQEETQVASVEPPKVEEVVPETAKPEATPAPDASVKEETKTVEQTEPVIANEKPVLVQAVDVEPNKVFIAGLGQPDRIARIYIDGALKGTVKIRPNGSFLFELNEGLSRGNHDLRIDSLGADGKQVTSRAAVVIDHSPEEPQVAEAKPEPQSAETKPAEPATAETKPAESNTAETKPAEPQVAETEVKTEQQAAVEPAKSATEAQQVDPAKPAETATAEEAVPVIKTGRSVIIRRGDNLWRISRRMLGAGRKYTVILTANESQIEDPNRIYPGQVFDVPDDEAPIAESPPQKAG